MDDASSNTFKTAPPPPPEVKIRTMRSDLESMARNGGGFPQFQNVKVTGLSAERESGAVIVRAQSKTNIAAIIATIAVVVFVAIAAWFVYINYFSQKSSALGGAGTPLIAPTTQQSGNPAPAPAQIVVPTSTPVAAPSVPILAPAFKKAPDQILKATLPASGAAQSAADLETYNQKLLTLLATANKNASFLEIDAKDSAGQPANINELLAAANAPIIDPQFLAANFNPAPKYFVYRDKNGFWPGYVVGLINQNQNFSSIVTNIQQIESSPSIANLFLENVGNASSSGFMNALIASSSVRTLAFTGGKVAGFFSYGWTPDKQYLILSTSQNGFATALQRLGY